MKLVSIILLSIGLWSHAQAQYYEQTDFEEPEPMYDNISLGLGLGPDYGGIGFQIQPYFTEKFGAFLGLGYNLAGVGYNVGPKFRFTSDNKIEFFGIAMYGYNAAYYVINNADLSKVFYGFSLGGGIETNRKGRNGYWTFALIIPLKDHAAIDEYLNNLYNKYGVTFTETSPISISAGYRFILSHAY